MNHENPEQNSMDNNSNMSTCQDKKAKLSPSDFQPYNLYSTKSQEPSESKHENRSWFNTVCSKSLVFGNSSAAEKETKKNDEPNKVPIAIDGGLFKMDYDDVHNDLENIFGLSLVESDERANSIFRESNDVTRGLSPIEFTPPDSPHEELTLDMLFGIPTESTKSKKIDTVKEKRDNALEYCTNVSENDDLSKVAQLPIKKNVPVYKQKSVIASLETPGLSKINDPNYDAFEFDDDELQLDLCTTDKNSDFETSLTTSPKREAETESIYIPGKGFRITNKPKDEIALKKQNVKFSQFNNNNNDICNENFVATVADSIRSQRDRQMTNHFLTAKQMFDTDCTKNRKFFKSDSSPLPKLIISIDTSRIKVEDDFSVKKRFRKRINSFDDGESDWDEASSKKKIIRKTYSLLHEPDDWRSLSSWQALHSNICDEMQKRLNLFGSAEGILPKGTYVVCKTDIHKDDCALWRVDNQTLLQKFPIFMDDLDKPIYKSSSTYSGWCEQISSQYFRVSVKILKQTRSEITIEPEIPLLELFPATSTEMFKTPRTVCCHEISKNVETCERNANYVALETLIGIFLQQSVSSNHLKTILERGDWSYTRSMAEITNTNFTASAKITQRIPIEKKHNKWITEFTRVAVTRSSFYCVTKCQICKKKKPRRMIHFFDKLIYDFQSLNVVHKLDHQEVNPVAVDAISCGRCSTAVTYLHAMKHTHLHLYRECEEKIEEIGTSGIDLSIEKCMEKAQLDKYWKMKIIQKYMHMWNDIRLQFRDD